MGHIEIHQYVFGFLGVVFVFLGIKGFVDYRKRKRFSKNLPDTAKERIHCLTFSNNNEYKMCIAECIVRDFDSTEEELYAVFHHVCIPNSDVDLRALRILKKRAQRYSLYMKISLLLRKVSFSIKTKYFKKPQKRILEKRPLSS
jgi:hypothetical protein